jgi:hypothetical protein
MKSLIYYLQIGPLGLTFWLLWKGVQFLEWILKGIFTFARKAIEGN